MWRKSRILDYNTKEEIESYQNSALQKQIKYLYNNSPFYKTLFDKNAINPSSIKNIDDLSRIPCTTKEDLERYNDSFLCVSQEEIVEYVTSSGTISEPIIIALTKNDLDRLSYNEKRSLEIAGISKSDTIQITTTLDKLFMAGIAYYMGAVSLGAAVIRSGIGNPGIQWENISRFKPSTAIAVSSFLYKLANYGLDNNIIPNNSSLKKAICIGEPIRNADFTENTLHQKISEKWDIDLFSTYASTEMMTAFTECEAQNGGHHLAELIVLELLDEKGFAVGEGELGEVTVTPLGVEGMPVLRYRTGDLARAHFNKCSCGRNTLRLGPIEGRRKQMIKLKGTTLFPGRIEDVLQSFDKIEHYVIELSKSSIDTDHICIYISDEVNESLINELKNQLSNKLRVKPEIKEISKGALFKMLFPRGNRKPKKILDNRSSKISS